MKSISHGKIKKQKSFIMDISASLFFIPVIVTFFFSSCTSVNEFTIGKDFVESQTCIKIVDTFKVNLSTVLLDSLSTSGTGVVLVGAYKDKEFGTIRCSSYFEPGFPTFKKIEDGAIFDSAAFILKYSGYYYGDTTSLMSISIHQLTERLILDNIGYLFNNSTFEFSPEALGTKLLYPEPNSSDSTVSVPVNEFGEELFRLIENNNINISTSELFLEFLKGFAITSDAGDNNAIIGFLAEAGKLYLKIYYHVEKETNEDYEISIPFGDSDKQYNGIQYDCTKTELYNIKLNHEISSAETGNKAFLQGLTGLFPKIQFPSLQDIFLANRWKILNAELIIEPVKTSYDYFSLPEELSLYDVDKYNRINGVLSDNKGNALVPSFTLDELYKEDTRYTFNITSYILNELSDAYFEYDHGLLIGLQETKLKTTLGRMLVEGKDPPVKLRLYYLTY
jgi:hypothetical protein